MTPAEARAKIAAWQQTQISGLTQWFKKTSSSTKRKKLVIAKSLDKEKTDKRLVELRKSLKKLHP